MLVDITIEDLGVIQRSSAEFAEGLTVLTGETGAGKTMVVTGLRLLAGGRADASRVRDCLLYTSPSPRDLSTSRMPSSA